MAYVLVVHDGVNKESEDAEDPVSDELIAEEGFEVEAKLEVVIAMGKLDEETAEHHNEHEQDLDEHEREELACEQDPAADGKRVHDLVEAGVALAPDEFAGVEGDDGEDEDGKSAAAEVDHAPGDGIDGCRERTGRADGGEDREQRS